VLAVGISAAAFAQQATSPPAPPPGPGQVLISERCGFCHDTAQVFSARKPGPLWAATVQSMIDRGAELDADEQKTVAAYLAANFAAPEEPDTPPPAAPAHS